MPEEFNERHHPPTLREIAAVVFRQRRLIVSSFLTIFLATLIYGSVGRNFRAEMKVLIQRGRLDPPVTSQPTAVSDFSRHDITDEELNSEVQLLQSEDVLREVVTAAKLENHESEPLFRHKTDPDARTASAIRRLGRELKIAPIRKTRLISVSYDSRDPQLAAKVLQSLAAVYMQKHVAVHRPSGEFGFFQQQVAAYSRALQDSEKQLLTAIDGQGLISPALQRDIALQELAEADGNYHQTVVAMSETERRIDALQSQLASLPERTATESKTSDNPELLQQLKSTLLTLELKRIELLRKFQPSYRPVQEIEEKIEQTKADIAAEANAPVRQETTDKDPRHEWASNELEKARIELAGLRAREASMRRIVKTYYNAAQYFGASSIKQQQLTRDLRTAEDNYLLYVRKQEEARIGDALDQRRIMNVAIVQEPRAPVLPFRSFRFYAVLGLALATFCSTSLAFAVDYLDPCYRTPDEVKSSLGIPVLACLPRRAA